MHRSPADGWAPMHTLKADFRERAIAFLGLEEFQLLVPHRSREEVGREGGDRGIEVAHDGVVITPGVLDRVFYGSELRLEIAESARRLELRIRFDGDGETAQRIGELRLGLRALRRTRALRGD